MDRLSQSRQSGITLGVDPGDCGVIPKPTGFLLKGSDLPAFSGRIIKVLFYINSSRITSYENL